MSNSSLEWTFSGLTWLRKRRRLVYGAMLVVCLLGAAGFAIESGSGQVERALGALVDVDWKWIAGGVALNVASVIVRSLAWLVVVRQAIPNQRGRPLFGSVFSAFCVGLCANALLPGRVGEVARVSALSRKTRASGAAWPTLLGTVVAHRTFDLIPATLLVGSVLVAVPIPVAAHMRLIALGIAAATVGALIIGFAAARPTRTPMSFGRAEQLFDQLRRGLTVARSGTRVAEAAALQSLGWLAQLLAVWSVMRAYHIHAGLGAAAAVLLVMNVVTILPFWPGNVGAVQLAIAVPLQAGYHVATTLGIAYGFGLQAVEASVGVILGGFFVVREGLSITSLRLAKPAPEPSADD